MTETNKELEAPTPVHDWENNQVEGKALVCKKIYDQHVERTAALRERQEAYEASLPKDPIEALQEIDRALLDIRCTSQPAYAARAALEIIYQLATHGALDDSEPLRESVYWLAGQGLNGLKATEDTTRRARNIAHQFHSRHQAFQA